MLLNCSMKVLLINCYLGCCSTTQEGLFTVSECCTNIFVCFVALRPKSTAMVCTNISCLLSVYVVQLQWLFTVSVCCTNVNVRVVMFTVSIWCTKCKCYFLSEYVAQM